MHLVWENLIKNLLKLWSTDFKGLDSGQENYKFTKTVWEAIGAATATCGSTIPSAFGVRVPNISGDGVYMSAEMLSFWTLYLGPILLRSHFTNEAYYDHFIELVRLLNICLQFEISDVELADIHEGFIKWVDEYERIYYQFDPERIALCPLTIHGLLHIAPSIKATGPVWCYWAFPMERYCGKLGPTIRSRRFPFAALARQVLEEARLAQIKVFYNVTELLSLTPPTQGMIQGSFTDIAYPSCRLLPPRIMKPPELSQLVPLIGALVTRFSSETQRVTPGVVKQCLSQAEIQDWGRVQRTDSVAGDTMRAAMVGKLREDNRDASFVRYEMYIDKYATRQSVEPEFMLKTFYGQLQHVYVVRFTNPCPALHISSPKTLIMAQVKSCKLVGSQIPGLDIHFYHGMGSTHVIDITSLQCVVGRVPCGKDQWAIIDRSGSLARAEYLELDDE
ncbi:hypothetical protein C8J55DRAFT_426246 [Lentinula edodes]|uniref:Transposase domain-containing protein n=1 Tax=Lentinula lateritia TaxID=40482 RepID=A0A9W8ZVI4_9AGAR|nr:hypothetical protein C8J55DRAFT_438471 [Lentinula edodes]KAJ4484269.1 hypothetical protein C8J55DRAFT_426246 [Lentinula edodes]